jgi:GNAT superfamily N-acetyltransferase
MQGINWIERAVVSEVAYSVARGGTATAHKGFIHIMNTSVPMGGDYNRAVGVRACSLDEFAAVAAAVGAIHDDNRLAAPDSYDTYPSDEGDGDWVDHVDEIGHQAWPDFFFNLSVKDRSLPSGFEWRPVSAGGYLAWRMTQRKHECWFDQDEWDLQLPSERAFIEIYRPFWLLENGCLVAWVHCANLGGYFRLFDVEVAEAQRGRGYGKLLLQAVEAEASRQGVSHILIRCAERLRGFYEACGFEECCRGSVIRLRRE